MIARKAWRLFVAHWPELVIAYLFALVLYSVVALVAALAMAPLAVIVMLALAPLAKGGLYNAVVRVRRNEAVRAGEFWQAGLRYWGRYLALCVLQSVVGLLLLLAWAAMARLSPILGTGLTLLLAAPLLLVLMRYAQYVAIAEDRGAGAAISRAWQVLCSHPGDLVVTALVLALAWGPYALLYLAERYESRISPAWPRAGGRAAFHTNPPSGAGV